MDEPLPKLPEGITIVPEFNYRPEISLSRVIIEIDNIESLNSAPEWFILIIEKLSEQKFELTELEKQLFKNLLKDAPKIGDASNPINIDINPLLKHNKLVVRINGSEKYNLHSPKNNLEKFDVKVFGRKKKVEKLERKLNFNNTKKSKLIYVIGPPGMGKTTFLKYYAKKQLLNKKYGIIFLIDLKSEINIEKILFDLVQNVEFIPENQRSLGIKRRLETIDCPWLLIFDGLEPKDQIYLNKHLPNTVKYFGHIVISTKYNSICKSEENLVKINRLKLKETEAMLTYLLKDVQVKKDFFSNQKHEQSFKEIVKIINGYPLAIKECMAYFV